MFDSASSGPYAACAPGIHPESTHIAPWRAEMLRRKLILSAGPLAGATALAACGAPGAGGGGDAGVALDKRPATKLEFWGGPPAAGQRNDRVGQIDFWNKKFPNIQID